VSGGTKFAKLAPLVPPAATAAANTNLVTRAMGAGPAPVVAPNPSDLGEGNMVLGPARPVAVKLTEPGTR